MIAFISLLGLSLSANDDIQDAKVIYKDVTEVEIETTEVTGSLIKPNITHVGVRMKVSFNPLIELRGDFNNELKHSINTIR